jgi:hypothetical protein
LVNLLDQFVLQHVQVSTIKAKLVRVSKVPGSQEAKVELNLTPRMLNADSGDKLPAYQVSARLACRGGSDDDPGPRFVAQVGFEAIYQQMEGEPVDISEFTDPATVSVAATGIADAAGPPGAGTDSPAFRPGCKSQFTRQRKSPDFRLSKSHGLSHGLRRICRNVKPDAV